MSCQDYAITASNLERATPHSWNKNKNSTLQLLRNYRKHYYNWGLFIFSVIILYEKVRDTLNTSIWLCMCCVCVYVWGGVIIVENKTRVWWILRGTLCLPKRSWLELYPLCENITVLMIGIVSISRDVKTWSKLTMPVQRNGDGGNESKSPISPESQCRYILRAVNIQMTHQSEKERNDRAQGTVRCAFKRDVFYGVEFFSDLHCVLCTTFKLWSQFITLWSSYNINSSSLASVWIFNYFSDTEWTS